MSVLNTESFDQELSVLLVGQENNLTDLVTDNFNQQQISVVRSPLFGLDSSRFVTSSLEKNQFYKIVVIINFDKLFDLSCAPNKALIDLILSSEIPKTFLIRVSSKINSDNPLCQRWIDQTTKEDELINYLYQNANNSKIILGLDVLSASSLLYPAQFIVGALSNGYLLNPQTEFFPIFEEEFFNSIKKELIKPNSTHLLIKGKGIAFEEMCVKFRLKYQDNFQSDLNILEIDAFSLSRFEKKNNLLEVVLENDVDKIVQYLLDNSDKIKHEVDPQVIADLSKHKAVFSISISKPFKEVGNDFEFELPILGNENNVQKIDDLLQINNIKSSEMSYEESPINTDLKEKTDTLTTPTSQSDKLLNDGQKVELEHQSDEFDQQVGKIFKNKRTEQKTIRRTKKVSIISKIKRKSKNKQVIFFGGVFLLLIGVMIGISFGSLSLNFKRSQGIVLKNSQLFREKQYSNLNSISFLGWQSQLLDKIFDTQLVSSGTTLSEINKEMIEIADLADNFQNISTQLTQLVFSKTSLDQDGSGEIKTQDVLRQKDEMLMLFSSQVQSFLNKLDLINLNSFNPSLHDQLSKTNEEMKTLSNKLQVLTQLSSVQEKILAVNEKKHYYILLQDNQELRPSGGFIQAIAMLVIEDGKLIDYKVFSTNSIDSKALGTLNSSAEIESMLGESKLFLRDANWNPDFSLNAKQIAWFIRESINQPVDGIIGINYNQVRDLLVVFEELKLNKYNEIITPHNLFSKLEQHAIEEKEEQQEENIHTEILLSLVEAIQVAEDQNIVDATEIFYNSLRNQQSVVYFQDPSISGLMSQLGWAGGLMLPECPARFGDNCSSDYLYQVEANVGVNKVNQYVSSRVNHSISIKEDSVNHNRQIRYSNKARSNIWPFGSYKAYIRFLVDPDAKLNEIQIDGVKVEQEQIREYVDNNRLVIGVTIDVPPGQEKTLSLDFSTPHKVSQGHSYFFFEQSQPGVTSRLSAIALNHPNELTAELISPLVDVNQNQVVVTSDLGVGFVAIKFASE